MVVSPKSFLQLSLTGLVVFVSTLTSTIPVRAEDSLLNQITTEQSSYTVAQRVNRVRRYNYCLRQADSRRERKKCRKKFDKDGNRYRRRRRRYGRKKRYEYCLDRADSRRERRRCRRYVRRDRYEYCLDRADSRREKRRCRRKFDRGYDRYGRNDRNRQRIRRRIRKRVRELAL